MSHRLDAALPGWAAGGIAARGLSPELSNQASIRCDPPGIDRWIAAPTLGKKIEDINALHLSIHSCAVVADLGVTPRNGKNCTLRVSHRVNSGRFNPPGRNPRLRNLEKHGDFASSGLIPRGGRNL